ncbi:acyl-CoA dehydrogenase family protein [Spirulina sp. 06S082]|uniref:acyl-CoA dehydrogenase family protein n=1 Tax=Spirulina sp. 06S082 TaxID=3110248 RepID=UPI002B211A77|nr:acyl-CoA dehydrogenase family protein [Spirulina sp. 06S082]MEA5468163.1 acyl-CoA dehydrogenase family protein [Spirulina sp. 06S082]
MLGVTQNYSNIIEQAKIYRKTAPNPEEMEAKTEALREGLAGLGSRSLLALNIPQKWGNREVTKLDYFCFQEELARYSGTLAFTQSQHQTAGSFIANGDNENLKFDYLPQMSCGQILVGVGYSHLRRQGKPSLEAIEVKGGYQLSGNIPWITGLNLFQEAVIAAALGEESILFALIPLQNISSSSEGNLHFSAPMSLAAMQSTNTVSGSCDRYFIPYEKVVAIKPKEWMQEKDRQSILKATASILGSARSGLDIVENASKTQSFITDSFFALDAKLNNCRQKICTQIEQQNSSVEEQLELRAKAIALASQCSLAAVAVSRGKANQKYHPAQRIYRETLIFTVTGQTNAVMAATLKQIAGK